MAQMQIEIWRDRCVVAADEGLIEAALEDMPAVTFSASPSERTCNHISFCAEQAARSFGAFVLRRAYGRTPGGFDKVFPIIMDRADRDELS